MDAFISYSSANCAQVADIESYLEGKGLAVWRDRSEIQIGALLREELHDAISQSRSFILMWSEAASASRWVAAELISAVHLERFILTCVLDGTPLPAFLQHTVYLDFHKQASQQQELLDRLCRSVRGAPPQSRTMRPVLSVQSPELKSIYNQVAHIQLEELKLLGKWKVDEARELHEKLDPLLKIVEERWRFDPGVYNLAAYHRKNAYMVKYWEEIQGGQPPQDPLLSNAERLFFKALFLDPMDFNALNGIASIFILERELDAAQFFNERAIQLAQRIGISYDAGIDDSNTIARLKGNPPAQSGPR
ncbi:toll/interleukin-1 receptor domain-containing protein [uncultured Azohydromonas sp.]|jgi:MTH538 TIR-like domain (DUF1863).|uniref:toll/interleukin-1 receptor domain-containing protein n=1 Tax=uncultured Azohydromonas sp. TaxID=487342 RepID=UPI0026256B7C|nr:toll/interleukin-1 receptor domain-containing protein [uncultured Azohydromonas sp.]